MFTGIGGGQGLQRLLTGPAESVAAIPVYVCHGRCALGSKENSHAGISRPCLHIPPLRHSFPVVCEHLSVLSGCVTSLFWEVTEKNHMHI